MPQRREQKPQQGEDLKHDSGGQKQILQFEQVRYQPKLSWKRRFNI